MEFTGQSKRHTFAANVRAGNKLNWEGEGGKRNGRKETWLQVEIPQPPRERWSTETCVGLNMSPSPDWSWEKRHDGAYEADAGGI